MISGCLRIRILVPVIRVRRRGLNWVPHIREVTVSPMTLINGCPRTAFDKTRHVADRVVHGGYESHIGADSSYVVY